MPNNRIYVFKRYPKQTSLEIVKPEIFLSHPFVTLKRFTVEWYHKAENNNKRTIVSQDILSYA